ncbi:hypothetical protein AFL01nite_01940 [Aeromicrobium flavum]|uniref:Uncharacterized protein n=1 Tax=Aeromicrobium flavum TaxID=416568 RepID=A0A512HQY9_9ACTN|nr:hypothetical protein [Aeromicrobium flavum]GEO87867.1 hypothetical protein AFL01nite_01940 [Aeromicrobium flavum]
MSDKGPLTGLPWLQLVAGALAAMTSAWVASYLGVAGTIIGAAVGSLVASVASAFYVRGLDKGTTFITESGSVVARSRPAGESAQAGAGDEGEVLVTEEESAVAVEESERAFSWKRVLTWTGLTLAAALLAIGAYELVTDSSFGHTDNPSIGRPWQGGSTEQEREAPAETEATPTAEPTEGPTEGTTTAPVAPPTTGEPTEPPTTAPAPAPSPTPKPDPKPLQPAEPAPDVQE